MTTHMIRFKCSLPSNGTEASLKNTVGNWTAGYQKVLQNESTDFEKRELENGDEYFSMDVRFDIEESEVALITGIENAVEGMVDWYILRYHVCDHDEDEREPCNWDIINDYGVVPEGF